MQKNVLMLSLYLLPLTLFADTLSLNYNWKFLYKNKTYSAVVPGCIHTDLLSHQLILDPFYGDNEKKLQWIGDSVWHYESQFELTDSIFMQPHIEMVFDGLDTYCKVYLNNYLIIEATNMFRQWKVDCKKEINRGSNVLRVEFAAQHKLSRQLYKENKLQLPGEERIMIRKAQYQFGWDWAPQLVTCGIWKNVYLHTYGDYYIQSANVITKKIENNSAVLDAKLTIISADNRKINLYCKYSNNKNKKDTVQSKLFEFNLKEGVNEIILPLQLENPLLWWCNGMGKPWQYNFCFIAVDANNKESFHVTKGIQIIRLVIDPDSVGSKFYFELNGEPVFIKGANYIPADFFTTNITHKKYDALINDVVYANMNMLRVWGGGIYENDYFYEKCSANGILIWQDFMFACAMYPYDQKFLANVKAEAEYQVNRLSKYSCIALWCGNNENAEGWQRWGWQQKYNSKEKDNIEGGYKKIFNEILPDVLKTTSNIAYWESSPLHGRGDIKHTQEGDAHNWFVWHDEQGFENYELLVPRFMSEFGFQSLPTLTTLQACSDSLDKTLSGNQIQNHQKHNRGFKIINASLLKYYWQPQSLIEYIYLSQLMQADGIALGIEAHRRAQPYCMGSLYWQLNDCWPSVSWSSIDYYQNKKALFYAAKKANSNLIISIENKNDSLSIVIVNNSNEKCQGKLSVYKITNDSLINMFVQNMQVENNQSARCTTTLQDNQNNVNYYMSFISDENIGTNKIYTGIYGNKLQLKKANIKLNSISENEEYNITISSNTFTKGIEIIADAKGTFTDNFFDMLPDKIYQIKFFPNSENRKVTFHTQCLNNYIK